VNVGVGVCVGSNVGVAVGAAVSVAVAVGIGLAVLVGDEVPVGVAVAVSVAIVVDVLEGINVACPVTVANWSGVDGNVAVGKSTGLVPCVVGTAVKVATMPSAVGNDVGVMIGGGKEGTGPGAIT